MSTPPSDEDLLDRVRKLLAKAEAEGVTPPEAEALTGKAAELMARYGIDRARLGAARPETDAPADKIVTLDNPWAAVKAHLLSGLVQAMRCQCVLLNGRSTRVHVFGYASDIERADILFTSLLVQMARALAAQQAPESHARAWRRSWLLGFISAVVSRVRAAEQAAAQAADAPGTQQPASGDGGPSTALVLADRTLTVRRNVQQAYPRTRQTRVTYTGSGYANGYREGQRADIGGAKLRAGSKALGTS
jgi:Protein of unknown function (DUF2786)